MEESKEAIIDNMENKSPDEAKTEDNDMVSRAMEAAERLEAANKKSEEILKKQKEWAAKKLLGGKTEAATIPAVKPETDREYMERVMRGDI